MHAFFPSVRLHQLAFFFLLERFLTVGDDGTEDVAEEEATEEEATKEEEDGNDDLDGLLKLHFPVDGLTLQS